VSDFKRLGKERGDLAAAGTRQAGSVVLRVEGNVLVAMVAGAGEGLCLIGGHDY
jgi:hypothetical protein